MEKEAFMRKAIEVAKKGIRKGQTPFGAVIAKKGKVVVAAHNVVWETTDITAHAEVNAIRKACRKLGTIDLTGCDVYSTTEPCPMCFSAAHWAGIGRIYYGTAIGDAKRAGFSELQISNKRLKRLGKSRMGIEGGVLRKECLKLFDEWKRRGGRGY